MEITGGSCEHSDLLGFESPLCFVWIGGLKEKVSWLRHYCVIALQIKRSDFFELSFLRLYLINAFDRFFPILKLKL